MASPASTNFLTAWRKYDADRTILVQVLITAPTAIEFLFASRETRTPDGKYWPGVLLNVDTVEAPGQLLSAGFNPCTCGFTLPPGQRAGTPNVDIFETFHTHDWVGATVNFWLWSPRLTSFPADALSVLLGAVVEDYSVSALGAHITTTQRRSTNQPLTKTVVTRAVYPHAPDSSVGRVIPVVYGRGYARRLRGLWDSDSNTTNVDRWERRSGTVPSARGVIVDQGEGAGGTKGKVLVASHAVGTVFTSPGWENLSVAGLDNAGASYFSVPNGDKINAASGSGFYVDDAAALGHVYIPPVDLPVQTNQGEAGRKMFGVQEYLAARLDYTALKRSMRFNFGSTSPLGRITNLNLVWAYRTSGAGDIGQQIQVTGDGSLFRNLVHAASFPSSTALTTASVSLSLDVAGSITSTQAGAWDFSTFSITTNFVAGTWTNNWYELYYIGLIAQYLPTQNPYGPKRTYLQATKKKKQHKILGIKTRNSYWATEYVPTETSNTAISGDYFCQPTGYVDAAYTGGGTGIIELPCDIAQHVLNVYGGVNYSKLTTVPGVHGSFTDARTKLATVGGDPMVYFRSLEDPIDCHTALVQLAEQSVSWFFLNRFTDKYCWVPWAAPATPDYPLVFAPDDMVDPGYIQAQTVGAANLETAVRVPHAYNAQQRAFSSDVFIGPSGSGAGVDNLEGRHEYLTTTVGVNNVLNYKEGATARSATLAAGDWAPMALAQEVATKMNAVSAEKYIVSWGGTIVAGYNDALNFRWKNAVGSTQTSAVFIPAGDYSQEGLATAVAAAMTATGASGITVSYGRTDTTSLFRLFTIAKAADILELLGSTGANKATSILSTLGFDPVDVTGGLTYSGNAHRDGATYALSSYTTAFNISWETGANGILGTRTNCSELVGFLGVRDTGPTAAYSFNGDWPKSNREATARAVAARFGDRIEHVIEGTWIRRSSTAREVASRVFDILSDLRVVVSFSSTRCPDLERGKIIQFSGGFDAFVKFPKPGSDGSWVNKAFYVTHVRQNMGPSRWDTEVTAIEAFTIYSGSAPGSGWGINFGLDWGPA